MQLFICYLAAADLAVAFSQVLPEWLIRANCGFEASNSTCKSVTYYFEFNFKIMIRELNKE